MTYTVGKLVPTTLKGIVMDAKVNFQNVVDQAVEAGRIGANEQLVKLTKAGPVWVVKNGSTPVGTMLDVCGFAHIRFLRRSE